MTGRHGGTASGGGTAERQAGAARRNGFLLKGTLYKDVMELGADILASERFARARAVPHHSKDGTIAAHCVQTAWHALRLARWLNRRGASVSEVDVVRASLLHDIGMTEDEVFLSPPSVKGKTHPVEGARIAREEFGANETQVDAILYHMWPVCTLTPPHSAVGYVVTFADKLCSVGDMRRRIAHTRLFRWGVS